MVDDDELARLADATFQQYFLVAPEKLALLFEAAQIQSGDRVLELGAGAGTVSRHIPPCRSVTVVELDDRLIDTLAQELPNAFIIQDDALRVVREIPCDVLLGNLPHEVTESLLDMLPKLSFRTAVLAMAASTSLGQLPPELTATEITTITGEDFIPAQPVVSRLIRISRHGESHARRGDQPAG